MKQFTCQVCGYVYDPAAGDTDAGVAPGTAFENLPDSWVCPVCGAGKDMFESERAFTYPRKDSSNLKWCLGGR